MTFSAMKFGMSSEDEAFPVRMTDTRVTVSVSPSSGKILKLGIVVTSNRLVIDWGDGTTTAYDPEYDQDLGKSIVRNAHHTYSDYGTYVIVIPDTVAEIGFVSQTTQFGIWDSSSGMSAALRSVDSLAPRLLKIGDYGASGLTLMTGDKLLLYCGRGVEIGAYGFASCGLLRDFSKMAKAFSSSGEGAFYKCSALTTLAGMSKFNPSADKSFYGCSKLTDLVGGYSPGTYEFGESIFEKCTSLASIDGIPSGLKTLGRRAFAVCTSLSSILPMSSTGVVEYPDYCFYKCVSLESLAGSVNVTSYGAHCFELTELIESFSGASSGLESCGDYCFASSGFSSFSGCPSSLLELGAYCFSGCPGLSSTVGLASGIELIGEGCFSKCYERTFDANEVFVSERGLSDTSGVASTSIEELPDYCFAGDGMIRSLADFSGVNYIGKYCFSGCSKLLGIGGLPTDKYQPASRDMVRSPTKGYGQCFIDTGVFSGCYDRPFKIPEVTIGYKKYKVAFDGLVDLSGLASLVHLEAFPDRMFEGCSLVPDLPEMPPNTYWLGDYCFSRCRNLNTLDSFANVIPRTGIAGSMGSGNETHAWLPHFGAYCFSECAWASEKKPNTSMLYLGDRQNPPIINNGLSRIGGVRAYCDRLEMILLRESEATHSYQTAILYETLYEPVLRSLAESDASDSAKYDIIHTVFSAHDFLFEGTGFTVWQDAVAAVQDSTRIYTAGGGDAGVIAFDVTPDKSDTVGGLNGVTVRFLFSWILGRSVAVDNKKMFPADRFQPDADIPEVIYEDSKCRLDITPTICDSSIVAPITYRYLLYDSYEEKWKIGFSIDVYRLASGGPPEFVGSISYLDYVEVVDPPSDFKDYLVAFKNDYLARAMISCYSYYPYLLTNYGGVPISEAVGMMNSLSSSDFMYEFHDALLITRLIGTSENIFGEGCFSGCKSLSVAYSEDMPPTKNLDGYPAVSGGISDYCFSDSGVSLTSAFKFVRTIGTGAFARSNVSNFAEFPRHVNLVPAECFMECEGVSSLNDLPCSLTAFGKSAFDGCASLSDIRATGSGSEKMQDERFANYIASYHYSECVDMYRNSRAVETLASRALAGTAVESLTYDWTPIRMDTLEDAQLVVKEILFVKVKPILVTYGSLDSTSHQSFLMRIRVGSWGSPEVVAVCSASGNLVDGDDDNKPGFDEMGLYLPDGCIGSVSMHMGNKGANYRPPYPKGADTPLRRFTYWTQTETGTDYVKVGDTEVRIGVPRYWYPGHDSKQEPVYGISGDCMWMFIGPYRVHVQLCFRVSSKNVETIDGSKALTSIKYELAGVRVLSCTRVMDLPDDPEVPVRVPVFPLLESVGSGCFEGCTRLHDLVGLPKSVTSLPSRCFAGCPFGHPVDKIDVKTPTFSLEMPVLDDRIDWQYDVHNNFFYSEMNSEYEGSICVAVWMKNNQQSAAKMRVLLEHVQDPETGDYTCLVSADPDNCSFAPFTMGGVTYHPEFVSVDENGVVVRICEGFEVLMPFNWYAVGTKQQRPSFDTMRKFRDLVEDEMRSYLRAVSNGLVAKPEEGDTCDFVFSSYSIGWYDGEEDTMVGCPLVRYSWNRKTGVWTIGYVEKRDGQSRVVPWTIVGTSGSKGLLFDREEGYVADGGGYFVLVCDGHEDWEINMKTFSPAVQLLTCSVDIPESVTSVGVDCFSFDKYMDLPNKLQAVYFHMSATELRRMNAFPFGVPPGCTIYANGSAVYTEPLPYAG